MTVGSSPITTRQETRDLTDDELHLIAGGAPASGSHTHTNGQIYLVFTFKMVAVKTVSW